MHTRPDSILQPLSRAVLGIICLWLGLASLSCKHFSPDPPVLLGGAAEIDITPPVGGRLAGYFEERIATGMHDPLKAKAIVLRQGRSTVALVFCDLVGLSLHVSTNARALASRQTDIPIANIVISATHTHTGPLFDDVRRYYLHAAAVAAHGTDPAEPIDYPAFLIRQIADVVAQASLNLKPVELRTGITHREGITFNRRYLMKNGKVAFNPGLLNPDIVRPAGPADDSIGMLLLQQPGQAKPFAGATVFSMHSDTVGGTLYSADYEYFVEERLRRQLGPEYISAFGLGCCGDLNHINVAKNEPQSGYPASERIGNAVAEAVLAAEPQVPVVQNPSLVMLSKTIRFEYPTVRQSEIEEARKLIPDLGNPKVPFLTRVAAVRALDLEQRGRILQMEVQALRIDKDTAFVFLPGEIFTELGLAIKQQSPFKHTTVLSICNDRPSYVPTLKAFAEGSYEVTNARVKPGTGERLVETALELLDMLR